MRFERIKNIVCVYMLRREAIYIKKFIYSQAFGISFCRADVLSIIIRKMLYPKIQPRGVSV